MMMRLDDGLKLGLQLTWSDRFFNVGGLITEGEEGLFCKRIQTTACYFRIVTQCKILRPWELIFC